MDILEQRRRKGGSSQEEVAPMVGEVFPNYEAALSQGGLHAAPDREVQDSGRGGTDSPRGGIAPQPSVSPSTLERGMVETTMSTDRGVGGPTASPFHSEKIRSEVELLRRRPRTLDADGEALRKERSALEGSLKEPDYGYGLLDRSGSTERIRVARVQTGDRVQETPGSSAGQSMSGLEGHQAEAETRMSLRLGGAHPSLMVVPSNLGARLQGEVRLPEEADVGQPGVGMIASLPQNDQPTAQLALTQGEVGESSGLGSNLTVALCRDGEGKPDSSDQRELVPASSSVGVEDLLRRVLEENRLLRVRLDQMETQSSWHSGGTRMTVPEATERSQVSFGPKGPSDVS